MKRKHYELLILSILGTASIAVLLLRIIFIKSYLPETGGVSINVVYGIEQLITTGRLYINPEVAPFSIIQYMPLHYYIIAFISNILKIQSEVHSVMVLNRLTCFIYDMLSVFFIINFIRNTFPKIGIRLAFSSGLLYFLIIPSIVFSRVDNLYLLLWILSISSLVSIFNHEKSKLISSKKEIMLAGIFSALALFTKQTALFLIVFNIIFLLLIYKDRKTVFLYVLSIATSLIILSLLLVHENLFDLKLNTVDGLKNGINLNWFLEVFMKNYFMKYTFLICTGIFTSCILLQQKKSMLHLFLGSSIIYYFLIAIIFSLKGGSGPNYYLEFNILSIFGICLLINDKPDISLNYFSFAAIILPIFLLACMNDKGWGFLSCRKKAISEYVMCQSVAKYIKTNLKKDNYVLTAFHKENSLNLLLAPKALFPCREVALYFTYPMGVFKFEKFKTLLLNTQVQYYIDEKGQLPTKFLHDDISYFVVDTIIGNYTIYKTNK